MSVGSSWTFMEARGAFQDFPRKHLGIFNVRSFSFFIKNFPFIYTGEMEVVFSCGYLEGSVGVSKEIVGDFRFVKRDFWVKIQTFQLFGFCKLYVSLEMAVEKIQFIQSTRIIGRKRVVGMEKSNLSSPFSTPVSKRRSRKIQIEDLNRLESLPQDILVRILCKVNHADLKRLLLVSKSVNEAAFVAKQMHFAFSTPVSKSIFNKDGELGLSDLEDSGKAPNAPMQHRIAKSRIDSKKLASIAVALFTDQWPELE